MNIEEKNLGDKFSLADSLWKELCLYHNYIVEHITDIDVLSPFELALTLDDGSLMVFDSLYKTMATVRRGEEFTEDEWKNEFGRRLSRQMLRSGATQERLAEDTGISRRMLTSYINGRSVPSARNATKLSKALNCQTSDLIDID